MTNATKLEFIPSITVSAGQIVRTIEMWQKETKHQPFSKVMITPLTVRSSTMRLVKERSEDWEIIFDSGGFLVQQGLISYDELCVELRRLYCTNPWANWMVLPDYVPTSQDGPDAVFEKVIRTVSGSLEFFHCLPDYFKEKAVPVIHGQTIDQANYCFEAYLEAGFKTMAFGSFATTGRNNSMNCFNFDVLRVLLYVTMIARQHGIKIHALGISSPAQVALLKMARLHSFDSSGWMRSAGHGYVYLPYSSGTSFHLTNQRGDAISEHEFNANREKSGHYCPFCADFSALKASRYLRMLHNLWVTMEVASSTEGETAIIKKMRFNSKKFYKYAETLLRMRDELPSLVK